MLRLFRIGTGISSLGMTACGLLALTIGLSRLWSILLDVIDGKHSLEIELSLIGTVDLFLLGTGILVITAGVVNLMIRSVPVPKSLQFRDLHQLKSTFASFLILAMAIIYLESLASLRSLESTTSSNPVALLYASLGFLAVTAGLVLFQRQSHHNPH
jgi:uncharacterized membrane protein YqhA